MTTISERTCQLGDSVKLKSSEDAEGASIPACEIPVGGLMLEANDVNALLGDPYAHASLFTSKSGHLEPSLPQVKNLVLKENRPGLDVTITIETTGPAKPQLLKDCQLKNLSIAPLSGGLTALGFTVHTVGKHVPALMGLLAAHLNGHITCEVRDGSGPPKGKRKAKQQDLPINTFGDGEQPETVLSFPGRRRSKKERKDSEDGRRTPH